VSTDTAFAPRRCPVCGRENPAGATRCTGCRAPLSRSDDVADASPAPAGEFSLPEPPPKGLRAPLPRYTAVLLVAYGATLGLYTYGVGLISLLALVPPFIYLYHRAAAPANPFRRPPLTGLAAWAAAAGFALVIFAPIGLLFVPALYVRVLHPDAYSQYNGELIGPCLICDGLAVAAALAAAGGAALFLTRRLFPPDAYD